MLLFGQLHTSFKLPVLMYVRNVMLQLLPIVAVHGSLEKQLKKAIHMCTQ